MATRTKVRNVLVAAGAYYISKWLALPLAFGWGKLTSKIIYRGDFAGAVLLPLVDHVPIALIAMGVGVSVVWLVESDYPLAWVLFPAALYALLGLFGYHWGRQPTFLDRISQVVGALFPALTCIVGGMITAPGRASCPSRHRETT
jgi:hypothetical protein